MTKMKQESALAVQTPPSASFKESNFASINNSKDLILLEEDDFLDDSSDEENTNRATTKEVKNSEAANIAAQESRHVRRLRIILGLILLSSIAGVSAAVYRYLSGSENSDFEERFKSDSKKILSAAQRSVDTLLGGVDSFATTLVESARGANQTFPFVRMPGFCRQAAKLLRLSRYLSLNVYLLVSEEDRQLRNYETFAAENDQWLEECRSIQISDAASRATTEGPPNIVPYIHTDPSEPLPAGSGPYLVEAFQLPVQFGEGSGAAYNFELLNNGFFGPPLVPILEAGEARYSDLPLVVDPLVPHEELDFIDRLWLSLVQNSVDPGENPAEPLFGVYYPIVNDGFDSIQISVDGSTRQNVVGVIPIFVYVRTFLRGILPTRTKGILVVMENTCGQVFTYRIDGPDTVYLGNQDFHDKRFDHLERSELLEDLIDSTQNSSLYTGLPFRNNGCPITIRIYPSGDNEKLSTTRNPAILTTVAALIFIFTSSLFVLYDYLVERRQRKILKTAEKSDAIVSSLFPETVRDRLFQQEEEKFQEPSQSIRKWIKRPQTSSFSRHGSSVQFSERTSTSTQGSAVADLYSEATVMFMDIRGFTAWSSARQPTQVFELLESLYGAFDVIAKRMGVFKVETIGDSYVAVTGLPNPQKDHAIIMAKFASHSLNKMAVLVKELEGSLGPGTGDLGARFGLHSGPVTAGVLRGDRARFQLFGDTVNTAARMESNGAVGRIQCSQATADLLVAAGKGGWLTAREDLVEAKGKGLMQTYWITPASSADTRSTVSSSSISLPSLRTSVQPAVTMKERLINYNNEILSNLLKRMLTARPDKAASPDQESSNEISLSQQFLTPRQEAVDVIAFSSLPVSPGDDPSNEIGEAKVPPEVLEELRQFITSIFHMYKNRQYHNVEHASHVVVSLVKLLMDVTGLGQPYGALVEFACVFAALVRDVDHPGVTNKQLEKEGHKLASVYHRQSMVEQNSIDLAWRFWMDRSNKNLRAFLCPSSIEATIFRQVVVKAVLAMDVNDEDLNKVREEQWQEAFASDKTEQQEPSFSSDHQKTVLLEYLVQAGLFAHTMQHWHVYRKWDNAYFAEQYTAYQNGRAEKDPTLSWYADELEFFDSFVVPLARKLVESRMMGGTCVECYSYAQKNQSEWTQKGEEIVAQMKAEAVVDEPGAEELEKGPVESVSSDALGEAETT